MKIEFNGSIEEYKSFLNAEIERINNESSIEYIDLGLPSGTLWAKCNIGATKPEEYGKYFQWGDTVGYYDASHSTWPTAPFNGSQSHCSIAELVKVSDDVVTLKDGYYNLNSEYDAVYQATKGTAHMPTKAQLEELTANTTSKWTTLNGVNGYKFTSNIEGYTDKSIFFPAAGYACDGGLSSIGDEGIVWSSSLLPCLPFFSCVLGFDSVGMGVSSSDRYNGNTIRGVLVRN